MPEPKLPHGLNERETFQQLKRMSAEHCDAQIKRLTDLKSIFEHDKQLLDELNACIQSYEVARDDIKNREYEKTPITFGMKGVGTLAAIGGLALVAVGPAVALAAGIATVAAGSATAGIGCVASNLTSQCTEGALMKPLVKAEEKTIALFEKAEKKKIKSTELTDAKKEFKTESANFKKRVGLFVVGAIYLLSAGIILAASHGALAPVALKIMMLGVKHISAGLVTASIATHASIGVGLITGGASMHSKRVAELKKTDKAAERNATESTPLRGPK